MLYDYNAIYRGSLQGFASLNISTNLLSSILYNSQVANIYVLRERAVPVLNMTHIFTEEPEEPTSRIRHYTMKDNCHV